MECARWLDPAFAIWCNRVIRGILNGAIEVDPNELPEVPVDLDAKDEDEAEPEEVKEIDVPRSDVLNWGSQQWPQEFVIALGKRVKSLALAFGVPARRRPHFVYGALYTWPDELFSFAMREMHQDPKWDHVFGRTRPKRSKYSKHRR